VKLGVEKGVSPGHPGTARIPAVVQHVSEKTMDARHISFYKLQLETGLCHATIHAIICEVLKMKRCVHTMWKRTWHQNESVCVSKNVASCSQFMSMLMVSEPCWLQEMGYGFITTLMKTKGSPCNESMMEVLCLRNFGQLSLWQADGHSVWEHGQHYDAGVAASENNNK
jgi:hypothetical protein